MRDSSTAHTSPAAERPAAKRLDVARSAAAAADAFDAEAATHPTLVVDCDAVVDPLHVTDSPDTVNAYRAAMRRGERFPPVSVVRLFGKWFVADGHKRFAAYRTLGSPAILVEVWPLRRWLRDHGEQALATARRWRAVLRREAEAPSLGDATKVEIAHLRRILVSLAQRRGGGAEAASGRAPGVARRLIDAARRHPGALLLTAAGFLTLSVTQLTLTWLVKSWIDGPLSRDAGAASPLLLPATLLLVCTLSAAVFVAHGALGSLHAAVIRDLRCDLQAHMLRLRVVAMESNAAGDLVARLLQDADVAGRFAGEVVRRGLGDALVLVGALAMLLVVDRRLFGFIVLVAPLGLLGHAWTAAAIRKRSVAAQRRLGTLAARFSEQASGHRTIKLFRTENAERRRFAADNGAHADAVLGVERWSAYSLASIWLVTGFALLGIGSYASQALHSGRLAAGDFLVFCLFGAQIVEPVRRLGELSTLAQRALAAGQRVFEVLDRDDVERDGGRPLPERPRGAIDFQAVRFAYSPERVVLADVTFRVDAGETVAVVAPSGGGKSTLAGLLVGFFRTEAGAIRLDDRDLTDTSRADLRRWVKVVTQDPFLFSGTVRENVRYGSDDAPSSAVDEAIRLVEAEAWLSSLPSGLDTRLEEAGRNLSGGQKQRLALARAVVADPSVLVLDEATSAIDSDAEERILLNLAGWLKARTVLLMTHRLSTVLRVPRVLVLDRGRIVEDGAPHELLKVSSRFAAVFGDQLRAGAEERGGS